MLANPNGRLPITRNTGEKNHPNINALWRILAGYALEHRLNETFTIRQNLRGSVNHVTDRFIYNGYSADSGFTSGFQADLRTLERFAYRSVDDYWTLAADTTLEARFTTGPVKHTAMAGVDYAYLDAKTRRWQNEGFANDVTPLDLFAPVYGAAFPDLSPTGKSFTRSDSAGFYVQEIATLFDRVTLLGGGRVDVVSSSVRDELADTTTKTHDSAFSPRVGAAWEFVRGASVYASYGKSFRPQTGFLQADGTTVAPETGVSYEAGVKTLLFDGRLTSTVAVFELTRQNVATSDPQHPGFYRVTGEQRSRGVEVDLATHPLPGLDFLVGYAYTNAVVTKDNDVPVGDWTRNVPRHAFNAWTKYVLQSGPLRGLGLGVGGRYYSDQAGDMPNTFKLPAYGIMDMALFYTRGPLHFQVNVENVLDTRYFPGSYDRNYVLPGAPLTVRGGITWRFDAR